MSRKFFVMLAAVAMTLFGGSAFASPPEDQGPPRSDPTCRSAEAGECPGDNGSAGCDGIRTADEANGDNAEPAMDMVTDILSVGAEGECNDNQRSERPGR